jgi:site-specific DNA recombinase
MVAAVYARKSTEQLGVAEDQKSITRQIEHATAFATRRGWRVDPTLIFQDDGISGADFLTRPGFVRLMNALKPSPAFQVLIMAEESRLGREAIETAYAMKQIVSAGVRVFFYLEDRERTLDSPTDKIMLSLTTFADELEREKARQRTYDAMIRKARAGHVTGGACFGYRNVEVVGPDGRRSHVQREIDLDQAAVIRQVFEFCALGWGYKRIAINLNTERLVAPKPQLGRSHSWTPSTVRDVLHRHLYRGEIIWNRSKKRNKWGQRQSSRRAPADWIRVPAPELQIVPDALWHQAHARLARSAQTDPMKRGGRPPRDRSSPYLLTYLAKCGICGGPLHVRSRKGDTHGRAFFYGCGAYHFRGSAVCRNNRDVPMAAADRVVLTALLQSVLNDAFISRTVGRAVEQIVVDHETPPKAIAKLERELARLEVEVGRLAAAIAAGGPLQALLKTLQDREATKGELQAQLLACRHQDRAGVMNGAALRDQLTRLAVDWQDLLTADAGRARPLVQKLLQEKVTFTPLDGPKRWRVAGLATLSGLFELEIFPKCMASPPGTDGFRKLAAELVPFSCLLELAGV